MLDLVLKANSAPTDYVLTVWNAGTASAQTALVSVASLIPTTKISDPAANNSLVVTQGQIFVSNGYLYVATANNYLKRIALTTF